MTKIAIIGAGSAVFTKNIVGDILRIPGLEYGVFALIDIDERRLSLARQLTEKAIELSGRKWTVMSSIERREVLSGSTFVISQIEVAGLQTVQLEYEIPLKYGVKQCIGDTLGPGGLFKTLRTLPAWLAILKDVEELCPEAIVLNYANPMSAITLAATRVTKLPVVGLCHSIYHTSHQLAEYLDVPYDELKWRAGGINHMAWFVELSHEGKNMYPYLNEKIKDLSFLERDPVRFDAMKYLGAFVSESSGHFSEYVPYYRKREDLIERHCRAGYNGATGFYASNWPVWRRESDEAIERMVMNKENLSLEPSGEYAPIIIEGVVTNSPKVIYGNVLNEGLISNLPFNGIVEVACLVDKRGVQPTKFGFLPEHLAALCRSNMSFFDLSVSAVLERSRELAMQALMLDPLTSAVCSLEEIKSMFDELFDAEQDFIGDMN